MIYESIIYILLGASLLVSFFFNKRSRIWIRNIAIPKKHIVMLNITFPLMPLLYKKAILIVKMAFLKD